MFEKAFKKLNDCKNNLDTFSVDRVIKNVSLEESSYVRELISLCKDIAEEHGENI